MRMRKHFSKVKTTQGIQMKKILKYILIGILIYVTILVIEVCCFYAVLGDDVWDFIKEAWSWYSTLF